MTLLAIPNVSEGRGRTRAGIADAIAAHRGRLLDTHTDPDHNRTVYTFAAEDLIEPLMALATVVTRTVDLRVDTGLHPHVGALDVAPVVHLEERERGAALARALVIADRLGDDLRVPVFLYGELAGGRTRASVRRGGVSELARRVRDGELKPDFGPTRIDPAVGATLVAARAPLVAFNAELAPPATLDDARAVAAAIRETAAGGGLPGVRAIGLWLAHRGRAQVSMNLEDYAHTPLAEVIAAIARRAPIAECELVGLAPRAAFDGFPTEEIPVRNLRLLEDVLGRT